MNIIRYDSGLLDSSMYVVAENGHAVVIDPCMDTSLSKKLIIDWLMTTHEHYDHISGVNAWKNCSNAPLLCSEMCAKRIKSSKANQARYFAAFCELQSFSKRWDSELFDPEYTCEADMTFAGECTLRWQGHRIRLTEIPGHSPGSTGIWFDEMFFSGDSLLEGREIELRFPGGSVKQWNEIGKPVIDAIPAGTMIFPGHFEPFVLTK